MGDHRAERDLSGFAADHFVRPVLIGGSTRLSFLWVARHFGRMEGFGLFLGPAIMAVLILLWREWVGAQKGPINPPAANWCADLMARWEE